MRALVIDTEGFGGMDENVNHDTRIFLFSLLLSSFFIYNSVGSIDENALNNISLIVNLAKVYYYNKYYINRKYKLNSKLITQQILLSFSHNFFGL
jgi:hypothetical protein